MESFAIICETCGARLRVRDARIIGEIHACPKCESMVQIVSPASGAAKSNEPPIENSESTARPAHGVDTPQMEFIEALAPPAPVAATTLPVALWAVVGGVLLLVGLAVGLWAGGRDEADGSVAEPAPLATATKSMSDEEPAVNFDPYAVHKNGEAEPAVEGEAVGPVVEPVEPVAKTPAGDKPVAPELPELPAVEQAVANSPTKAEASDEQPATERSGSAGSDVRPPGVMRFDPLDFDPARLSLAADRGAAPAAGSIVDDPAIEIETESDGSTSDRADNLLTQAIEEKTLHVRLGPAPSATSSLDGAAQLATPVEALEVVDMPLARFAAMVSDLAGVPITLDPVALELAGATAMDPVSVQAKETTLEAVLRDGLAARRLEPVEEGGQARVSLRGRDGRRSVDYEVKDLAGGGDASNVAALVERFVAPSAWRSSGGRGTVAVDGTTLRVEQSEAVHHAILIFCERLRLARGLPTRSRYPTDRLSIESPYNQLAAKLKEPTTFTFLPWERLRDVVEHWQEESRMTILVDWSALAEVELGPASPIACSAIDRPWEEALDGILEPLGLAWWAVDGQTIQITSRDALDAVRRIGFHAVPQSFRAQFASEEAVMVSLAAELRDVMKNDSQGPRPMQVELDKESGRLIVLAAPQAHRHLSRRLGGGAAAGH